MENRYGFQNSAINVHRKVIKVVLPSLPVNTVSIPPVNGVKVTTTRTYQYTDPAPKHAVMCKSVFKNYHVSPSPAPPVVTLNA